MVKTYRPKMLPLKNLDWEIFVDLLGKAHATLARYDQIIQTVQHPRAVFSLITAEELLSSLQSQKVSLTLKDLWLHSIVHSKKQNPSLQKVLNYQSALLFASNHARKHPMTISFLCKIHKIIKRDVRSLKKDGGRFRQRQNWIGPEGCTREEAYFFPPPFQQVLPAMDNLKHYLHSKEKDSLVQLALFFAQLLVIHPFMDGNGRLARVLIPCILYKKEVISTPLFYLSAYFKRHRLKYFEKLFLITAENDWEGWIRFFLQGIIEEGERSINKAERILKLYQTLKPSIKRIETLFATPIFLKRKISEKTLKTLQRQGWIHSQSTRDSLLVFSKLLMCGH